MSILSPMCLTISNIVLTCNKKIHSNEITQRSILFKFSFKCLSFVLFLITNHFDLRFEIPLFARSIVLLHDKNTEKKRKTLIVAVFHIDDLIRFSGYHGLCRKPDYIIVIAHCCRCMRASHGRGPPNDPEHQRELVQRRDWGRERKG